VLEYRHHCFFVKIETEVARKNMQSNHDELFFQFLENCGYDSYICIISRSKVSWFKENGRPNTTDCSPSPANAVRNQHEWIFPPRSSLRITLRYTAADGRDAMRTLLYLHRQGFLAVAAAAGGGGGGGGAGAAVLNSMPDEFLSFFAPFDSV